MTIREIIDIVQVIYSRGVPSDDSGLLDRQVYNKLTRLRVTTLSQKSNKNQFIGQWNYQPIHCIEMEKVPIIECPTIPPTGMYILRSKELFPSVVSDANGYMIESITALDGLTSYGKTTWKTRKYQSANRYTSKNPDYFIRGGKLWITSNKYPEVVTSVAIHNDPLEVYLFNSGCYSDSVPCIANEDREFPLDQDIIDSIAAMSQAELIDLFGKEKNDDMNNAEDDNDIIK